MSQKLLQFRLMLNNLRKQILKFFAYIFYIIVILDPHNIGFPDSSQQWLNTQKKYLGL